MKRKTSSGKRILNLVFVAVAVLVVAGGLWFAWDNLSDGGDAGNSDDTQNYQLQYQITQLQSQLGNLESQFNSVQDAKQVIVNQIALQVTKFESVIENLKLEHADELIDLYDLIESLQATLYDLQSSDGDYAGTITNLNAQISDLNTQLNGKADELVTLGHQLANNVTTINSLNSQLDTANQTISNLNATVTELQELLENSGNNGQPATATGTLTGPPANTTFLSRSLTRVGNVVNVVFTFRRLGGTTTIANLPVGFIPPSNVTAFITNTVTGEKVFIRVIGADSAGAGAIFSINNTGGGFPIPASNNTWSANFSFTI